MNLNIHQSASRLVFCAFLFCGIQGKAQDVDFSKVIPDKITDSTSYLDKLVYWAWQNHPNNWVLEHQIQKAEKNIKLTRYEWTKNVTATFNLNEKNIYAGPINLTGTPDANSLLPRYNFGIRLSIGDIVTNPISVKMAKHDLSIAQENYNEQKLIMRSQVIQRYERYLLRQAILKHRTHAEEEMKLLYSRASDRFKKGELTLEEYSASFNTMNKSLEDRTIAETELRVAKVELEEMLGTILESIK